MPIHRRRLLRFCSLVGTGAIAGCLGGSQAPTQETKLSASDGDRGDYFGDSVALSRDGTTALIGATVNDRAGSGYIFTNTNESWSQQAKLTVDDGDFGDSFGHTVALSGDGTTALIGAQRDDDSGGSAYIFTNFGGSWTQQAKLTADDSGWFGSSVAISKDGTTALVGDVNGEFSYIFTNTNGSWSQQAKLPPNDVDGRDAVRQSVAVSGDGTTALVGGSMGAAYIYTNSDGSWSQQAEFTPDLVERDDAFGESVALSSDGTTAVISAPFDDDSKGTTYIFTNSSGSWSQQDKIVAADRSSGEAFGHSVAVSDDGTAALIGAPFYEEGFLDVDTPGLAYFFKYSNESWVQQAKPTAEDGNGDKQFGSAVAVSGDGTTALIGARIDEEPNGDSAGSAYVFSI